VRYPVVNNSLGIATEQLLRLKSGEYGKNDHSRPQRQYLLTYLFNSFVPLISYGVEFFFISIILHTVGHLG
jgi:hypothetical protein